MAMFQDNLFLETWNRNHENEPLPFSPLERQFLLAILPPLSAFDSVLVKVQSSICTTSEAFSYIFSMLLAL